MADAPTPTDSGIAANAPAESEHIPGAADPDSSEPQIPRVASAAAGPGDVAHARKDEPVMGAGRAADARGGETRFDADGRPIMVQPVQQQQAQATPGPQEESIEGPGYPTEDMDDLDDDDDDDDDDEEDEDDEFADLADVDGDVQAVAPPELGDAPIEAEDGDTSIVGDGHADKAAWNRERIAAMQDDESEPGQADTFGSQAVLGHGDTPDVTAVGLGDEAQVAASAAGRTPGGRTPGSSEDLGYGGGAPNEDVDPDVPGLDTGDGRLDELTDATDLDEEANLDDAAGALDDTDADADTGRPGQRMAGRGARDTGEPGLPESREYPDEGVSDEERIIADGDEDGMFGDGGLGAEGDLEMEELNEIDDIANDFEDQRIADDSADGNEERTWRRD